MLITIINQTELFIAALHEYNIKKTNIHSIKSSQFISGNVIFIKQLK